MDEIDLIQARATVYDMARTWLNTIGHRLGEADAPSLDDAIAAQLPHDRQASDNSFAGAPPSTRLSRHLGHAVARWAVRQAQGQDPERRLERARAIIDEAAAGVNAPHAQSLRSIVDDVLGDRASGEDLAWFVGFGSEWPRGD